ncbi:MULTISPECIES: photosystem I reaction center subunit PsaK [Planktothrix]|uniref:Photosystem I reaction center subunit PsaK n=3 Tax=Microcoleaceae TaxID=1892252 RepID=A0A4P5ZK20_PLAAG|nr:MULTISPECIES: photosystem I reaction center subunit PsaK [Planktothrix]CAD5927828.1 Photosystem I reaction center subunit PsaK [Planktothrix rubescens]MCB8788409.1 photosystem I reaction center subunit PsaK [Planktothrix agardhii 1025]MCF3609829.1 photosystem I reaction center subunit PsaK [Planktothrix agardhii 1027]CAC5340631.1 Photosystem I reaction center subunit PsaK [Planktothrix rubescens NIVA-CYA 18]CAD5939206.1 Photosystem I reaction center subunit PsaK [Planktothrix rubescens NIVA
MIYTSLLMSIQSNVPATVSWSPSVAIVMIISNLLAIFIGFYAISKENRGKGPSLPGLPRMFTGFGFPELLATASFGHILGAGVILALGNAGVI